MGERRGDRRRYIPKPRQEGFTISSDSSSVVTAQGGRATSAEGPRIIVVRLGAGRTACGGRGREKTSTPHIVGINTEKQPER